MLINKTSNNFKNGYPIYLLPKHFFDPPREQQICFFCIWDISSFLCVAKSSFFSTSGRRTFGRVCGCRSWAWPGLLGLLVWLLHLFSFYFTLKSSCLLWLFTELTWVSRLQNTTFLWNWESKLGFPFDAQLLFVFLIQNLSSVIVEPGSGHSKPLGGGVLGCWDHSVLWSGARPWEALSAPCSSAGGCAWMSSPGILTCWGGVLIQKWCSGTLVPERNWSPNAAVNTPNPGLLQPNSYCVMLDRGWRGIFVWFFSSCWSLAAHPLSDSQLLQSGLK